MSEPTESPDSFSDPSPRRTASRRLRRDPVRDLLIPVVAIGLVVLSIVGLQLWRHRETSGPELFFDDATGEYTAIELGATSGRAPKIGGPAPSFALVDPENKLVRLGDFAGRPVLLNFWATWCVPCQQEVPDLVDLQAEWGEAVSIVGINLRESGDAVKKFAATFKTNYPLVLDSGGEVTRSYRLTGLPETYFVDADGILRDHRIGVLKPDVARCIVASIQRRNHDPENCR